MTLDEFWNVAKLHAHIDLLNAEIDALRAEVKMLRAERKTLLNDAGKNAEIVRKVLAAVGEL